MQTPHLFIGRRATTPACGPAAVLAVMALLLCACGAQTPVREDADEAGAASSEPTVYGQLGVSVDHVSVR